MTEHGTCPSCLQALDRHCSSGGCDLVRCPKCCWFGTRNRARWGTSEFAGHPRSTIYDNPSAPSHTYKLIESLLPFDWFQRPPPERGMRLTIVGRDGTPTQWDFDDATAAQVASLLSRRPTEARITHTTPYRAARS